MTTPDLEKAVVGLLNPRKNAIVPNVSWGLGLRHECDLLYLDDKNRFTEVELKVSKYDLLADFKKPHGHISSFISRLAYAVPENLLELAIEVVPKECGIIVAYEDMIYAQWVRIPKHNKLRVPDNKKIIKFLKLGTIRIWKNRWK